MEVVSEPSLARACSRSLYSMLDCVGPPYPCRHAGAYLVRAPFAILLTRDRGISHDEMLFPMS